MAFPNEDWDFRARIFNAITFHPDTNGLLFSRRRRLSDRIARRALRTMTWTMRWERVRRWWWDTFVAS